MKSTKQEIFEKVLKNGGVSIKDGYIMNADYGYQVALSKDDEIVLDSIHDFVDFLESIENFDTDTYGVWVDEKTGLFYIDKSSRFIETYEDAMTIAKYSKQLTIYSWTDDCLIEVR